MREFSRSTFSVLADVRASGAPATLTNRSEPVAEITPISAEDARRYAAEMAAQSQAFMARLRRSDEDLDTGKAKPLDEFLHRLEDDGGDV